MSTSVCRRVHVCVEELTDCRDGLVVHCNVMTTKHILKKCIPCCFLEYNIYTLHTSLTTICNIVRVKGKDLLSKVVAVNPCMTHTRTS